MGRQIVKLGRVATWVLACCAAVTVAGSGARQEDDAFDRWMNLAKAHIENRKSAEAIEALQEALALRPSLPAVHRNLARAYRIARKPEDALASLATAAKHEPDSAATAYLTGLAYTSLSRFDDAIEVLEQAVRLDPTTAPLRYQLAGAYQASGSHEKAVRQLEETIRLDPLHASAYFKLATYARQRRDMQAFQKNQREFLRLRKIFGDESRTPEALEICVYTQPESAPRKQPAADAAATPAINVRFVAATAAMLPDTPPGVTAACVLDVDEAGRTTIVTIAGSELTLVRTHDVKNSRKVTMTLDGLESKKAVSCLVGDFYNEVPKGDKYDPKKHAQNDVLILSDGGVHLLQRTGPDAFKNVTESAGLEGLEATCARWIDFEVDGDVDLVLGHEAGIDLWQNNGNGTFERVTEKVGVAGGQGVIDLAAVDLENNVAPDLIVARGSKETEILVNQRAGRYASMPSPPGPWPAAIRVLAGDLNNDTVADVALLGESEVVIHLGGLTEKPRTALAGIDPTDAALMDYDNDGWVDICVAGDTEGGGAVRLYRNLAGTRWQDVTEIVGLAALKIGRVSNVLAVDVDNDRDTDLLATIEGQGLHALRNDGGHANGQLKVRLETLKSNPSGIGVQLEVRDGKFRATHLVDAVPIEIGLGDHRQLDSVRMLWTNGIVDNHVKVDLAPGPMTLVEKNVAAGSCPLFYAWDGRTHRFITDLLGNAPIGLSLARDVLLPADPDEYVEIGSAGRFPPRDGAYEVVITDEFREIVYLDYARLVALDHPADQELHPTDKLMPPPFPMSEIWAMRGERNLRSAVGDDGLDRTAAIAKLDGVFAAPGRVLPPPYRGMCRPMTLTMDFGPLDADRGWVLAMTGWLQYGDASTNIAMSQDSDLAIIAPTLEVETTSGQWLPIDTTVGLPAGKTKTILTDLMGKVPPGARRLRLTTSFEVRWDRIALFERASLPDRNVHAATPTSADLYWRGFSEIRSRKAGHPTTPDFDTVFPRPAWDTALEGWCTAYGDVLELMRSRDDRLVVMNAGDALTLRFDAANFPRVPDGYRRTFFFYSIGWDKDGDHNVVGGEAVAPMPWSVAEPNPTAEVDESDWQIQHNTRFVPRDRYRPDRCVTTGPN